MARSRSSPRPRPKTSCRSTASTTSSFTSATRCRPPTPTGRALGFKEAAYAGLETGVRDRASHVLEQGRHPDRADRRARPRSRDRRSRRAHGDGVKVIALGVPDVDHAYREATARGAARRREPRDVSDEHGTVRLASIATYGDTLHTFVDRRTTRAPSCRATPPRDGQTGDAGLLAIDHIVGNVELGHMDEWVKFYEDVFGLREMLHFADEDISTEYSALMSKVVHERQRARQVPDQRAGRGQAQVADRRVPRVLRRPGAQHIAVATARHRRARSTRCAQRRDQFLRRARDLLRRRCRSASARSTRTSRTWPSSASSSTATTRATCCRSSPSRSGPPDAVLRGHRAPRRARLRRGQLQGAVRGDRARAGLRGNL